MKSKQIIKIMIDIAMTAVLLLLMTYELIGQVSHELLGIIMFVLFILHHILNSRWTENLIKGKYTALRTLQTVLVVSVLFSMAGSIFSGVMLSRHIFSFLPFGNGLSFIQFTFTTSFLYYMDYNHLDEQTKNLYRQGMSAFGGISPTYHIALAENAPVIVWNFHSLLVMIQMCFSFMLTDSDCDMKLCKHCGRAFIASRKGNKFCSPKCKNQYNVYKTRAKKKED